MMADARRFGNVLRLREESRDVWGWTWLDDLSRDMRYALRSLARAPGFTAVAVLSLALATGATTAIFSIVNGVILRPLPFGHPDRLVQVYGRNWGRDEGSVPDPLTGPVGRELEAYNQQSTLLESTAGYDLTTLHLAGPAGTERLKAVRADLTFFSVLDVPAQLGRTFRADDGPDVAVISAGLWERRFQRDPTVSGRSITLEGRPFTIVGVMPDVFQFPYRRGLDDGRRARGSTDRHLDSTAARPDVAVRSALAREGQRRRTPEAAGDDRSGGGGTAGSCGPGPAATARSFGARRRAPRAAR